MKVYLIQPMSRFIPEEVREHRELLMKFAANELRLLRVNGLDFIDNLFTNGLYYEKVPVGMPSINADDKDFPMSFPAFDEMKHLSAAALGRSIWMMSTADLVIGWDNWCTDYKGRIQTKGCSIERQICDLYGIPYLIMPSIYEKVYGQIIKSDPRFLN